MTKGWDKQAGLALVRKCLEEELGLDTPLLADDDEDLVRAGIVDSMGWVGTLTAIEGATGIRNFGNPWPAERPQSVRALVELIVQGSAELTESRPDDKRSAGLGPIVAVSGWGYCLGELRIPAAQIEKDCALEPGTLSERAGIESVCHAGLDEDEIALGQRAAELALEKAGLDPSEVDLLIGTSTTFLRLPSLASTLHSRLLLPESCVALDVGGACVGVVQALATARAWLAAGQARIALVVAAEVTSRRLDSAVAPGDFRGLFGDGACAFVLSRSQSPTGCWELAEFTGGCSGASSAALTLEVQRDSQLHVEFEGETLAAAAISRLKEIVEDLETLTRTSRADVAYFALHEPNPRVMEIVSRRMKIPLDKMEPISRTCGNLGAATCGVNLCIALANAESGEKSSSSSSIFVAAVGPGLLFGGARLQRSS